MLAYKKGFIMRLFDSAHGFFDKHKINLEVIGKLRESRTDESKQKLYDIAKKLRIRLGPIESHTSLFNKIINVLG